MGEKISEDRNEHEERFILMWNDMESEAYTISANHGFHEQPNNFGERIALIHSELSEALEYYRKGNQASDHIPMFSGVEEEIADAVIRILDLGAEFGLDVANAILEKQKFNATREYKHGKAF